jgi:ATP-dependent Lon protease
VAKLTNEHISDFVIPEKMPLLLLQDTVVFPLMRIQLLAERSFSIAAVEQALIQDRLIFLVAQREVSSDDPTANGPYQIGTICILVNSVSHEEGTEILVQGVVKAKVTRLWQEPGYMMASL